jgi:crotonobetainyl-CoA:carnitine CoA-transferase CaiB-like acyl-CoA transferase
MRQFGIHAEGVIAGGTTWASITAYGRSGPRSNHVGYGDDVAATAGLVVRDNGVPMPCGDAIADPLAGVHAAVAIAAALLHDDAFLIDVSMYDVAAAALELKDEASEARDAVDAASPGARVAAGRAADLGQHTDDVLRELGVV